MSYGPQLMTVVAIAVFSSGQAATIFVDDDNCPGPGSGTVGDPFCSIQDAIDAAVDSDEVVVAPGTYFETIDFLGKAITLRSTDGPEVTTIDAGGDYGAGSVVICDSAEGPGSVLQGLTITGGFADFGGGIYNANSSPTVIGCVFLSNVALSCVDGLGGGMYNANSSPTVIRCAFRGNSTSLSFDAAGGGMYNSNSNTIIMNCLFDANVSNSGGGMCNININSDSSPAVTNCTFSGNLGGGIVNFSINPVLTNCVFRANDLGQIVDIRSSSTVSYSNVQGGWPGIGNIDADPMFVDPDNGDFRLQAGSPCIDAGDNIAVPEDIDTDLDGNPRFVDDPDTPDAGNGDPPIVDMGAYEFQGTPCPWDLDGDGNVFVTDLLLLLGEFGTCDGSPADFDGDGCVTVADLLALMSNFGLCPGVPCIWDVNGDGVVDQGDVAQIVQNMGPCDGCPEDINGEGFVNGEDVAAVATHFGPCP